MINFSQLYDLLEEKNPINFFTILNHTTQQFPDNVALQVTASNSQRKITFAELKQLVVQFATLFKEYGIEHLSQKEISQERVNEPVVAIACQRHTPCWVIAALSAWQAGAAFLLLDTNTLTQQEIIHRIKNVGCKLVVTDSQEFLSEKVDIKKLVLTETLDRQLLKTVKPEQNFIEIDGDYLAYIGYTSGYTGTSKAFAINHRGIPAIILFHQKIMETTLGDSILQTSSLNFDASLMELFLMSVGVKLVLCENVRNFWQQYPRYIKDYNITLAILTPSIMEKFEPKDFPSLRSIVATGEPGYDKLFKRWQNDKNRQRQVFLGYGPSEYTIGSNLDIYEEGKINLGESIFGSKLVIVDDNNKIIENDNIVGKIALTGIGLMRGYVDNTEVMDSNFIRFVNLNDDDKNIRYFLPGDIAYQKERKIYYIGRSDRLLKFGGLRIYLPAIEELLEKTLRKTFQIEFERIYVEPIYENNSSKSLIAFIKTDSEEGIKKLSIRALQTEISKEPINGFIFPKSFYLLTQKHINENQLLIPASGKFNHKYLTEIINDSKKLSKLKLIPIPYDHEPVDKRKLYQIEERIKKHWVDILQINANELDIENDTFSGQGGNSLLAGLLMRQLVEEFELSSTAFDDINTNFTIVEMTIELVRQKLYRLSWDLLGVRNDNESPIFFCHPISGDYKYSGSNQCFPLNERSVYGLLSPVLLASHADLEELNTHSEKLDYEQKLLRQCVEYYRDVAFCEKMRDIARYATIALKEISKNKPVLLCGYSFGSCLAYAIAKNLEADKVLWLGLLDGAAPTTLKMTLEKNIENVDGLKDIQRVINTIAENKTPKFELLNNFPHELLPKEKIKEFFQRLAEQIETWINYEKDATKLRTLKELKHLFFAVKFNLFALCEYHPDSIEQKIKAVLYSTTNKTSKRKLDNYSGSSECWQKFIKDLDTKQIDECSHKDLLWNESFKKLLNEHIEETKMEKSTNNDLKVDKQRIQQFATSESASVKSKAEKPIQIKISNANQVISIESGINISSGNTIHGFFIANQPPPIVPLTEGKNIESKTLTK